MDVIVMYINKFLDGKVSEYKRFFFFFFFTDKAKPIVCDSCSRN